MSIGIKSTVMRKLSKIWIALFFVWISKISEAWSLPVLTTEDTNPVKNIGSNWTIECFGDRPVNWNYTNVDTGRKSVTTKSDLDGAYPFSAVLSVSNISYHDVETYKCHYADDYEDQDWSITNCTLGNITCAHLFVDDKINLLATYAGGYYVTLSAFVGVPLIIPCRPTSPKVQVTLSRSDGSVTSETKQGLQSPAVPVIPNSRITYSDVDGFTIDPVRTTDADLYNCEGKRGNKTETQFMYTIVQEPIHELPKINASLATAVKVGESFTLNCTIDTAARTPFDLKWSAPKSIIDTPRAQMQMGSTGSGTISAKTLTWTSLTVTNVSKEDSLDYVCTLNIKHGKKSVNYSLEIFDEGEEFLNVSTLSNEIEVNASSTAKWVIEMKGFPKIESSEWLDRNNETIDKSRFYKEEHLKDKSSLVILKIFPVKLEDAGIYYFLVRNRVENSTVLKLNLTVRDVPSVELKSLRNKVPSIGQFYHIRENYTFECIASGYPHPDIVWLFNNCSTPFNPKFAQHEANTCEHLQILESSVDNFDTESGQRSVSRIIAQFETSGNISCEAINDLTEHYSSSQLSVVKLIDFVDDEQTGFTIVGNQIQAPLEGNKANVVCAASKNDYRNNVRWYLTFGNSSEQLLERKTEIKGATVATQIIESAWSYQNHLIIDEVTLNHHGTYTCKVEDFSGVTFVRNLYLKVQQLVAPIFDDSVTNLNNSELLFRPGDILPKLKCSASGVPAPHLTWLKDGVPSQEWTLKFKKLLKPDPDHVNFTYLQIPSQSDYDGNYTCRAENSAKRVEKFVKIRINDHETIRPGWIVVIVILSVVIILLLVYVGIKTYKDRKLRLYLINKRRCEFQNGDTQNINPELPVSDQVNLLPYYDTWEFPKENLKLGIQLGSGAFGRVVKAEALGIVDTEPCTTVAVKMVKPNSDDSHINALVSELKIMVHLGRHVNVVNLLGACTKDLAKKKELLVIVEYCRYGSLLSYLHRHRSEFVDQLDPTTGALDRSIMLAEDRYNQSAPRLNYAALTFTDSKTNRIAPNGYRFLEEINSSVGETERPGAVSYNPSDDYILNSNVQSVCTDMSYVSNSVVGTDGRRRSSSGSTWNGHYRGDYQPIDVRPITTTDLLCWSFQIARGMEYLASRKVLHGDLAARNVLLSDGNIVKICDFGLAKEMYQERYKKKSEGVLLPVKWMAIESICFGVFSTQSDVWSYGVVLWELFTLGKTPYPGMEADQRFYNMLTDGYRMEKPALAPSAIFDLMSDCWNYEPSNRPIFSSIADILGDLIDENLREHFIDLNEDYSRMNQQMMEGKEDYLIQMGGADFVYKEPSAEPDYANVESTNSNYLEPTKPDVITKYENLDGGPKVQQLANNAGYIFMNTHQNEPDDAIQHDIFSPRPIEVGGNQNHSFGFENSNLHNNVELSMNFDCGNDGTHHATREDSKSPSEEIHGVSNINYVPNTIFLPEVSNTFANNRLYQRDTLNSNKTLEENSAKKRIKNDSGVSSLGSASDFRIPSTANTHGDLNGHGISPKDNQIYFQNDNYLSPILVDGSGCES